MKKILVSLALISAFCCAALAQHEYAPIKKEKINYENWTYKNIVTGEDMNLREFAKDKKLVLVLYFAPWCHNSQYQMPFTKKLYEKYKDRGLGVVGVSSYASEDRVENYIKQEKIDFPVVAESFELNKRIYTKHYKYRQETGDKRKWGTPFNVFLVSSDISRNGEILVKKPYTVAGELIEADTEKFIREKLGLPAAELTQASAGGKKETIEACSAEDSLLKKIGEN